MDIITLVYSGLRIIIGFLLLLFIPGFVISCVFYPKMSDLRLSERLVYSSVMSIGSVIINVLFMDLVLGIDTTPKNIIVVIFVFSLFLTILWIIRRFFLNFSLTEKISNIIKNTRLRFDRDIGDRLTGILERYKNKPKEPPHNDTNDNKSLKNE